MVETHDHPVYWNNAEAEQDGNPWYYDIKTFLKDGKYLESANVGNRRGLRDLACRFFLIGEILYKKACDGILLRCVDASDANQIMS